MNFSFITVSFPVDDLTYNEMKSLCDECYAIDEVHYNKILNIPTAKNYEVNGFFVLAYHDETDKLVGLGSAIDLTGLNTFEWSIVVHPMYRQIGLGNTIFQVVQESMEVRQSVGNLALIIENRGAFNKQFIEKKGYHYSFSEATLEVKPCFEELPENFSMRPFIQSDKPHLIEIFTGAFGDTEEEAIDLIEFNQSHEKLILWTAIFNEEIVGTITTRKEGQIIWITAFAVHSNMEGKGIGTTILKYIKNYAANNGEKLIMLDVEMENERARSVYEKAGFMKSSQIDYYAL